MRYIISLLVLLGLVFAASSVQAGYNNETNNDLLTLLQQDRVHLDKYASKPQRPLSRTRLAWLLSDEEMDYRAFRAKVKSNSINITDIHPLLEESHEEVTHRLGISANFPPNIPLIKKLFWFSTAAYCGPKASLLSWTCAPCKQFGAGFKTVGYMNDDSTKNFGFVGYTTATLPASPVPNMPATQSVVVVSFRGTTFLANWIQNLNTSKLAIFPNYPNVRVHQGFFDAYSSVKDQMFAYIQTAMQKSGSNTIIFTGHSLGGAMTMIAAMDMKLNQFPRNVKFGVYTQGSPRVGDVNFRSLVTTYIEAQFRQVHDDDIVPHVPLNIMGFVHSPYEIFWNEDNTVYKFCTAGNGEDPTCANGELFPVSIEDHTHYYGVDVGNSC